jgi:hypothetical protein
MSAVALDLLAEAHRYGMRLVTTSAGTIKARASQPPPLELLAKLRAHRAELITALTAAEADDFDERAAIIADNGVPRAWAESYANCIPTAHPATCR